MKKILLFAMAMVVLPLMAQDDYPKYIDSGTGYVLNGVNRSYVNTTMLRMIIDEESAAYAGNMDVVADRWYSRDWDGSPYGYGYDTIARMHYENHVLIMADTARLSSDEYKNVLWTVNWSLNEIAPSDTLKTLHFYYYSTTFLSFDMEVDTSYTAYAGRPYRLVNTNNPLMVPLTYSSSKESVGTVDHRGYITVVDKGETMITATYAGDASLGIDSLSASWKLVVKEGDHYELQVLSWERSEHQWSSGSTYLGFDMVKVTSENCGDIYGNGMLSFDIETRTLTMNNLKKVFTEEEDGSMGWMDWLDYESGPLPLNIRVVGDCEVRHNSAGMFVGWDLYITGDANSSLVMEGRFPQFSAANRITVDGTKVHVLGSAPHPLVNTETLEVRDNSYLEIKMDIEAGPGEDPREWGAMTALLDELELGDNTAILTEGVHVEKGTFVQADGRTALYVEIGPKTQQGLEEVMVSAKPQKVMVNGQIYIIRDNHIYTTQGQLVK